jgi:hypothetical protein
MTIAADTITNHDVSDMVGQMPASMGFINKSSVLMRDQYDEASSERGVFSAIF